MARSSRGSAAAKTRASAIRRSSGAAPGETRSNSRETLLGAPVVMGPRSSGGGGDQSCGRLSVGRGLCGGPDPDRREGLFLAQLDPAFADELQRGGEAGGARAAPHGRIAASCEEPVVEGGPVRGVADQ